MSSSDSESEESDSEWTQEDKALMVSNPRKFFKKNYSKFNNSKFEAKRVMEEGQAIKRERKKRKRRKVMMRRRKS